MLAALFMPQVANAASHASQQPLSRCLQAPADLNPQSLSEAQLEVYGLPLRPTDAKNLLAQTRWLQLANHIKLDHHDCHPQSITGALKHHPEPVPDEQRVRRSSSPDVTKINDVAWAGNYDVANAGSFSFSSANWNLPCMNTSTRGAAAGFWVGLGGYGNGGGSGYTPQAGTDVYVDSGGGVTYTYWIEDAGSNDYSATYALPEAVCRDTMYVEVDSPLDGSHVYYLVDGGGTDQSFTPNWPVTSGDSGECLVERLHSQNTVGVFLTLADFNYITFSNCSINGEGIGDWPHNYYVMVNNSGQQMASPGAIINSGLNYNVNWSRAS